LEVEPFVSIVIPTTGKVRFIRGLVESVARLDYPKDKFELILIGDRPTRLLDKHAKEAEDESIDVTVEYEPLPAGQKRNIGAKIAKGTIIAFTDDDTILREDWIRNGVKHLSENEKYVGVGGPNYTPREELPFAKAVGRIFGSKFLFSFRYTVGHSVAREIAHNPTCNYLIKKNVVQEIQFHESLWPGEDVEFDIRLNMAGYRILYAPDVVVWHHRRSRPAAFLKQMFNYGKTRAQVTWMHPRSFDIRHFAFVMAFIILMSLYFISYLNREIPVIGELDILVPLFLNSLYFAILGVAGLLVGYQTGKFKQAGYAPLVLFIQHFGYSLGLVYGFLRRP
tara:strand:- start:51 stop:1061 length:1011 start_codon:yes stop_codon:yes gene_type:complete